MCQAILAVLLALSLIVAGGGCREKQPGPRPSPPEETDHGAAHRPKATEIVSWPGENTRPSSKGPLSWPHETGDVTEQRKRGGGTAGFLPLTRCPTERPLPAGQVLQRRASLTPLARNAPPARSCQLGCKSKFAST